MDVVVTGATGHVGAHLTRKLIERGDKVRAFYHSGEQSLKGVDCERIVGDIRDADKVSKLIAGAEVVYHLAAKISLLPVDPDVHSINVGGVENVTEACKRAGVRRLVHFSSIHAFSTEPGHEVLTEERALITDEKQPPYDRSKAEGHRVVKKAVSEGLDAVVMHPGGIIGPHDYLLSRMGRVLLSVARGKLPSAIGGGFTWVDVRDVVAAALAAETMGRKGENYLLSGHWLSVREIVNLTAEVAGVRPPLLSTPMWLARAVAPAAQAYATVTKTEPLFNSISLHALRIHRHTSHAKAKKELGYDPRPTRESVADAIAWFRDEGHLG